jgi:hypothetical protein
MMLLLQEELQEELREELQGHQEPQGQQGELQSWQSA